MISRPALACGQRRQMLAKNTIRLPIEWLCRGSYPGIHRPGQPIDVAPDAKCSSMNARASPSVAIDRPPLRAIGSGT
jgi:hypothetical protein